MPDTPQELTCGSGEMVCGDVCANTMTSDSHCGNCTTSCLPTQGCMAGSCVDRFVDCKAVRAANPAAPDGVYANATTNVAFYCDFTGGQEYEDFRFERFDQPPAGFTVARAADFAMPVFARAFIGTFNSNRGVRAQSTFTIGNCCITTVAGLRLRTGAVGAETNMFPGVGAGNVSCTFSMTANAVYTMSRTQSNGYLDTLPDNFFTAFPPSEAAGCSESTNPAIFYKRHPI